MSFCEDKTKVISIPKYQMTFIYFLLKNGDVVYVGQTTKGIARPFAHKDKDFDEIKIIYCEKEQLDLFEDTYIQKYKPIYNKQNNYAVRWGMLRVRNKIREITGVKNLTIPTLKKIIKPLNITIQKDIYNGNETISFDEYKEIIKYLERGNYEIHNRGI